ncbi:MAG: toll/interleukin-1 receptor domain-containing protein [Candidatus Nitrosocosmicus sp.]
MAITGSSYDRRNSNSIFISYATEDLDSAIKIYKDLKEKGFNPWLDKENILPGQNWDNEIKKAIKSCRHVVILLSSNLVKKISYIQKELKDAIREQQNFPESSIFIIPARLDECNISYQDLQNIQYVDLYPDWNDGLQKILNSLNRSNLHKKEADYDNNNINMHKIKDKASNSVENIESKKNPPNDPNALETGKISLMDSILDKDPSKSITSSEKLIKEGRIDFKDIIDKILVIENFGFVNTFVFKMLCKAFPQQSSSLLIDLILKADKNWHAASIAADCFSVSHRKFAEEKLCNSLKEKQGETDIIRMCLRGLGNIGSENCVYSIFDTIIYNSLGQELPTAYYDKLYHYACEALASIFMNVETNTMYSSLQYQSRRLQHVLKFAMSQPEEKSAGISTESIVEKILAKCSSYHVDILVIDWLYSEEAVFRKIGAYALGQIRISRAVPDLIKSLDKPSEDSDIMQEISKALGNIGGNDAIKALLVHRQIKPIAYSLGELNDFNLYDQSLQELLRLLKESDEYKNVHTSLFVYRAIGLKKDNRYVKDLRQLLYSTEPSHRGVAALALARINGIQELDVLRKSYKEAGSTMEKVLIALSLLEIKAPESNDVINDLRNDLTIDSYQYIRHFREDIISILLNTQNPLAIAIANSWKPIYDETISL